MLLDLLERCPVELRNLVLGCLSDIAETATGLQHMLQWQGQGNPRPNITALLCALWRDTCVDLQCPALVKGGLIAAVLDPQADGSSIPFPLHSQAQAEAEVVPAPGTTPGLAVVEVLRNERAKIYGLCGLIGFDKCSQMLDNNDRVPSWSGALRLLDSCWPLYCRLSWFSSSSIWISRRERSGRKWWRSLTPKASFQLT